MSCRLILLLTLTIGLTHSALAGRVLHTEKSLYQNIAVVQDSNIRCLKFSLRRKESQQSCIDVDDPKRLVLAYLPVAFAGLAIKPDPARVLVLGLGGGTIINVFSHLFPESEIDAVEIDPAVVKVARNYFDFEEKPGTRVHVSDGRVFVRRALRRDQHYDYILLDAFNGDYIPEHMMTREFLEECRELLSADGVLVANTFSSSRLYDSESRTYEAAFGSFLNLRRQHGNRIIVAVADGTLPAATTLYETARSIDADLGLYGIDLLRILTMDRGRDWRDRARILTDQYAPANLLKSIGQRESQP